MLEPEPEQKQIEFKVVLEGYHDPSYKIAVIKVIREITGFGLKEAKDLVENTPKDVRDNLAKHEADAIRDKLIHAGAKVAIR